MRKLTILFAALTLSAGLWALDNVAYIDAAGQPKTANGVNEITDATEQVTWNEGWYVVTGTNVQLAKGAICQGAVNIILADGAKLTATGDNVAHTPGIQVSGTDNSLTIYGQVNQTGELIAKGGDQSAGIGGGDLQSGDNITINGGKVTATGGQLGAGIGGGNQGSGSNITIHDGEVTATGGIIGGAGIGGGWTGSGSKIFVATSLVVKADGNNPPTTVITNTGADLAKSLAGKRYVMVTVSVSFVKAEAIAAIEAAIEGVTDEAILAIANQAQTDINAATTVADITSIKNKALADIAAAKLAPTKTAAINTLQTAADAVKAAIDDASTYEAAKATQDQYKAEIDATVSGAIYNINNATSKGAIDEEVLQAKTDINYIKNVALVEIIKINELAKAKAEAVAEIQTAGEGIQNTTMRQWIDATIEDIQGVGTTTIEDVERIKGEILNALRFFKDGKAEGIEEGKAEAQAELPTDAQDAAGHTVTITKGDKTLILVNPDKVTYGKQ